MKKLLYLFFVLLFINQHIIAQVPSYVPTNGLLGYWPFSGNADDESGNDYNGLVNGAILSTDRFGNPNNAYSFFLEDDYISLNENLVFTDADGFTVSIWMKKEDLTGYRQGYLFDISDGFAQNKWQQRIAIQTGTAGVAGQKAINFYGDGLEGLSWQCITTDVDEFENQWINVVGVVDMSNNAVKLYINGIEAANSNTSGGFDSISLGQGILTSKILGRRSTLYPSGNQFYGEMDDLAIWNRALTPQEIGVLYDSGILNTSTENYESNINIYPNPVNDKLLIDGVSDYDAKIYNNLGQFVMETTNTNTIDVSTLSKGIYFIKVSDGINSSTKKFIKN